MNTIPVGDFQEKLPEISYPFTLNFTHFIRDSSLDLIVQDPSTFELRRSLSFRVHLDESVENRTNKQVGAHQYVLTSLYTIVIRLCPDTPSTPISREHEEDSTQALTYSVHWPSDKIEIPH